MNDRPDLRPLLRALEDAQAALPAAIAAHLPPDLQSKYDSFRKDLHHMSKRAQALRTKISPSPPQG